MAIRLTESALRRIVREEAARSLGGPRRRGRKSLTESYGGRGDLSAVTSALQTYMTSWMRDNNVVDGAVGGDPDHDAAESLEAHIMGHVQDVVGEFIEMNMYNDSDY